MPSYELGQANWSILAIEPAEHPAKATPPESAFSAAATSKADRDRRDAWLTNTYSSAQLASYT
jgi:hypothetical protein